MNRILLCLFSAVLGLMAAMPAASQGEVARSRLREGAAVKDSVRMKDRVAEAQAKPTPVILIPDAELLKGLELSQAQQEALVQRLKSLPFKTARPMLQPQQAQAQRLPTGELFQVFTPAGGQTLMQQTFPVPGAAVDPCATPDHTDGEISALRTVLTAQLRARGGNVDDFAQGYPGSCRRKQLIYLLSAAVVVAAR